MKKWFLIFWILGLVLGIPYCLYYLAFEAAREQYALLITLILFWIFGYWAIAGPVITLVTVYRIKRTLDTMNGADFKALVLSEDGRESAVELVASDNGLPRFIARRVVDRIHRDLASQDNATDS